MTNIDKIRAEIERLKKENETHVDKDYAESQKWHMHGAYHVLFELSNFIDSLTEEPVSEDLEEELNKWQIYNDYPTDYDELIKLARHFATWQKEQLMAKAIDGKVIPNGMGNPILHLWDKGRHLIDKKVKVIVIAED